MDRTDRRKHYPDKSGRGGGGGGWVKEGGLTGNLNATFVKKQDMNTSSSTEINSTFNGQHQGKYQEEQSLRAVKVDFGEDVRGL